MIRDSNGDPITSIELTLETSTARIYTLEIDCYDGHTLSNEPVIGAVVEARHGTMGSWTLIEAEAIDLSPYAGNLETFQVRITAETDVKTAAFRLRVGPSIAVESPLYNGSDEMLNDSNEIMYVGA